MNDRTIICPRCGAKTGSDRQRCPRCRTPLGRPDPVVAQARSRRLMLITAAMVLLFGLSLLGLWYSGRRASPPPGASSSPRPAAEAAGLEPGFLEWRPPSDSASGALLKALEEQRAAVTANPGNGEALASLGRVQLELGAYAEAVASLRAATDAEPQSEDYRFELAHAQCALALWDECIESLGISTRLAPDRVAMAHNLGIALQRRGRDEEAAGYFTKARDLPDADPAVTLALAVSLDRLGRPADAREAYQDYLRQVPAGPIADRARARLNQLGGES